MNADEAANVLADHNRWRRDGGDNPQSPTQIGIAIDVAVKTINMHATAMDTLRQIADGKRKTRERSLACGCLVFLETITPKN